MTFEHTINTQEIVAKQALGLLEEELLFAQFVNKDSGSEFNGAIGDTINVPRPSRLAARELEWRAGEKGVTAKDRQIVTDLLNESKMPVKLNRHFYTALDLTDEQLTLNVDDFGAQVTAPQARGLAEKIEGELMALVEGQSADKDEHGIEIVKNAQGGDPTEAEYRKAVLAARARLNKDGVPLNGRVLIIGSNVEAELLNSQVLTQVSLSGTSATLREAVIGRYFGFTVVVSTMLNPDAIIALHPSAFIFVSRAPMTPPSVTAGASVAANSAAVRSIRDYNSDTLSDRQVISTFAGFNAVTEPVFKEILGDKGPDKGKVVGYELEYVNEAAGIVKQVMKRSLLLLPKEDEGGGSEGARTPAVK
ncbi:P22 phage major capsid protein family protein [Streptomyces sp. NPDC127112]|uniref:P22 phage major capsid protein family protein n=1 Tax=Streptomyces sp. NPDC127112 TaxID=3345364 RepID=UPI003639A6DE